MRTPDRTLAVAVAVMALGAAVPVTAPAASAVSAAAPVASVASASASVAGRNGVCESGEFCYYYNSNNQGSLSDFTLDVAERLSRQGRGGLEPLQDPQVLLQGDRSHTLNPRDRALTPGTAPDPPTAP